MVILRLIVRVGSSHRFQWQSFARWAAIPTFLVLSELVPLGRAATFGDFEYAVNGSSVIITSYKGTGGDITIPDTIGDKQVTTIQSAAFDYCTNLTGISIPNVVTNIGNNAFAGCTGLTNVALPGNIGTLGDETFSGCSALTSIGIPNSVTNIGQEVFAQCTSLTNISIPHGVFKIGFGAFNGCNAITRIGIPNSVRDLGQSAFGQCTGLTNVIIPNNFTNFGSMTFQGCTGLRSVTIPDGVTNISSSSFRGCTNLADVKIGNNVATIELWAFAQCSGLTNITIPKNVTRVLDNAFGACTNLTLALFEGNVPTSDTYNVFRDTTNVTVYYRAGTTGWHPNFAGRPTALWGPSFKDWAKVVGLLEKFPDSSSETDDADKDGLSNLQELQAGTDPIEPNSVLSFESTPRPNDLTDADKTPIGFRQYAIYVQTVPGRAYRIERASKIRGTWSGTISPISFTATTTQKRILVTEFALQEYFRVVLVP